MKYTRKYFDGWLTYEDEDIKSLRPSNFLEIIKLSLIMGCTVIGITIVLIGITWVLDLLKYLFF